MQSAIPVWVTVALAFLAPVAALVGVVVGAVMQRRTTRLQLEAARERDRELWAREDRHRFTEQKRVVYAELLTAAWDIATQLAGMKLKIQPVLDYLPGMTETYFDAIIEEEGFAKRTQQIFQTLDIFRNQILLIAPQNISAETSTLITVVWRYTEGFKSLQQYKDDQPSLQKLKEQTLLLGQLMRNDLASDSLRSA